MHVVAKVAVGTAAVGTVVGFWWLLRPETEEERNERRKRFEFQRGLDEMLRPYFMESSPTVIANIQRAQTFTTTSVILVGNLASLGDATFSVNGTPVPYPPAKWRDAAYTRLYVPVPSQHWNDELKTIRVMKGGVTRVISVPLQMFEQKEITVANMGIE